MDQLDTAGSDKVIATGISGLDDILRGGFTANCLFLIEGESGAGKTTLAIQFLLDGAQQGETCLYVTLSESRRELELVARSHNWDLSTIKMFELGASKRKLSSEAQLTMFNPSEIELGETTEALIAQVELLKPTRVVIDSLSELRLMAQNPLRYRRQVLALKHFFSGQQSTVLLLDDTTSGDSARQIASIAHGVVQLEHRATQYGAERRRLRVVKMRGVGFRGGYHDFVIRKGGLDIFPRLIASEHHGDPADSNLLSGNKALDALLCGGIPLGTSTLLLGPAGTGKSTLSAQFISAAAERGERSALFIFDENINTYITRCRKVGVPLQAHIDSGMVTLRQIDPAELSPGELAAGIRRAVAGQDGSPKARVIVIDSLNGYLNAMPEERFLSAQMHELLAYLGQQGVVTFMTVTPSGMLGSTSHSPVDTTYLADNVILFRFFEDRGSVRRAISVMKKRSGAHEQTIRELSITSHGVEIGPVLNYFQGVLSGTPQLVPPAAADHKTAAPPNGGGSGH